MKFLKSKMFLILLSVALVLTVIPATLSAMGHTGLVRNVFMTVTFPVRWVFNTVARGFAELCIRDRYYCEGEAEDRKGFAYFGAVCGDTFFYFEFAHLGGIVGKHACGDFARGKYGGLGVNFTVFIFFIAGIGIEVVIVDIGVVIHNKIS